MIAISITVLLFLLIATGMPLAFALAGAGCVGLWIVGGFDTTISYLATTPFSTASQYELMTIPMFVLMAEFVIISGVADELFDTIDSWTRRLPGGLGLSTIITGASFSSICGSSAAAAATLASTAIPQMRRHGYDIRLATGLTAIVGTLSSMIPPANGLIIYGLLSEADLGKLLIAGLLPGLIGATVLAATLQVQIRRRPDLIARKAGAVGALVIAAFRRKITLASLFKALRATVRVSTMITLIIAAALLFGYFLTLSQATQELTSAIGSLPVSRWIIISLLIAIKLLLGCFMDQVALLVLTVPITLPIVVALGFDPIWYGIVLALTSEIGLVTPPIGLNAYIVARYTGIAVEEVFAGVTPYMFAMFLFLIVLVAFPDLTLWLPGLMHQ